MDMKSLSKEELKELHDMFNPEHSGVGGHWCGSFDGMYVCDDCRETWFCRCGKEGEQ